MEKIKDLFNRSINWIKIVSTKQAVISVLLLSLAIRLFYLSLKHPLWWDSHVYIGMGKYFFSGGAIGIWESFRPLLHPIILGAFWKSGFNPIFIGKLLDLIFSLVAIYLTYLIGKKIFNRETGLIGALIFSFTPLFIMFTGLILTEPLAITFAWLGIYLFLDENKKWKLFLSGIFLSLSLMTKFPQGIIFGALFLILGIKLLRGLYPLKKEEILERVKQLITFSLGFGIIIIPYLIFNYYRYGNMLEPFLSGSQIVTTSTWVYGSGITFYLTQFFFRNWIYLFFFVYLYYFIKERQWKDTSKNVLMLSALLFLFYFTFQVPRKEVRYLVTVLPFLSVMIAYALIKIYYNLKSSSKPTLRPTAFIILCVLMTVIHIPTTLYFEKTPTFEQEILKVIADNNITEPILTTDPALVSFADQEVVILSAGLQFGPIIYGEQKGKYGLLFLNDCDLICSPGNLSCQEKREKFLNLIAEENKEVFRETAKECTYLIYLPRELKSK